MGRPTIPAWRPAPPHAPVVMPPVDWLLFGYVMAGICGGVVLLCVCCACLAPKRQAEIKTEPIPVVQGVMVQT